MHGLVFPLKSFQNVKNGYHFVEKREKRDIYSKKAEKFENIKYFYNITKYGKSKLDKWQKIFTYYCS